MAHTVSWVLVLILSYSMTTNCAAAYMLCKSFSGVCIPITVPPFLPTSFLVQHPPSLYGCTRQRCMPQRSTTTSEKQTPWQNWCCPHQSPSVETSRSNSSITLGLVERYVVTINHILLVVSTLACLLSVYYLLSA